MGKEDAEEIKVAKVEVVKEINIKAKPETKEKVLFTVFVALIGAVIGVFASLFTVYVQYCFNEKKTKEETKSIISSDIKNTIQELKEFTRVYSREALIERSKEKNWAPNIIDYDTSVIEAYIHNISILPKDTARRILYFYRNLRGINGAKYILQNNGSKMTDANRKQWAKVIWDAIDKTNKLGNEILNEFSGKKIVCTTDSYWINFQVVSSTIDHEQGFRYVPPTLKDIDMNEPNLSTNPTINNLPKFRIK